MHVSPISVSKSVCMLMRACVCVRACGADNDLINVRAYLVPGDMEAFCGEALQSSSTAVGKHIDSDKLIPCPDVTPHLNK